ncbi:hypothetical protein ACF1BP_33305 [Streptomyces sp. NPDC014735]|uniref:hypothetical protein n=1 Tax=unclassified Streptomyces TaxID=2593676 RepID=UPI0036FE60B5
MDDSRFLDLLESLCRRPAMYTGERTVASVAVFMSGYFTGASHSEPAYPDHPPYGEWNRWVEMRYDVFDPAWSWTRILLHHHVDDQGVLKVLPSLFHQFLKERDAHGVEELAARHSNQFADRRPAPERTHTKDPH